MREDIVDRGKVLYVDLAARQARTLSVPEGYRLAFLGGVGLASRLLWDYCPPGVDPFDPASPLVFAAGAFTGTPVPAGSRTRSCSASGWKRRLTSSSSGRAGESR